MITRYQEPWLDELILMERYCNDGSPTLRTFSNSSSSGTSPLYTVGGYCLPLIKNSHFDNTATINYAKLDRRYEWPFRDNSGDILIPIHPDVIPFFFKTSEQIESYGYEHIMATPSASPRTVLISKGYNAFWLKLSYPGVLNRFGSSLQSEKIKHSLRISSELYSEVQNHALLGGFLFESLGIDCKSSFGAKESPNSIVRNIAPSGIRWEDNCTMSVIPFFSLFAINGMDFKPVSDLWQWVLNQSNASDAFCSSIVAPLIKSFWSCIIVTGLVPEPHSQNVLLTISKSWEFDIIWRDFQGFYVDSEVRKTVGRADIGKYRHISVHDAKYKRSSLIDGMLWKYILRPLFSIAVGMGIDCTYSLKIVRETTEDALKKLPAQYLPNADEYWEMPLEFPEYGHLVEIRRGIGCSPIRSNNKTIY